MTNDASPASPHVSAINARDPNLPRLALSVRQPWAWAIIHAGKHLENRTHGALLHMSRDVRAVAIHASQGMTQAEYERARAFMLGRALVRADAFPAPGDLIRGAIIGRVDVVDRISKSASPWFMGPRALVLANPVAVDAIGCDGALGFFDWERGLNPELPAKPKPWMVTKHASRPSPAPMQTASLFE